MTTFPMMRQRLEQACTKVPPILSMFKHVTVSRQVNTPIQFELPTQKKKKKEKLSYLPRHLRLHLLENVPYGNVDSLNRHPLHHSSLEQCQTLRRASIVASVELYEESKE